MGSSTSVDALDSVLDWLLVAGAEEVVAGAAELLETVAPAAGVPAVADEQATVRTAVDSRAAAARLCFRWARRFMEGHL